MGSYQVVRIEQQLCAANPAITHVVAVATGNRTLYNRVWQATEVLRAIDQGDSFYTQSVSGDADPVYSSTCDKCGAPHIQLIRFDGPTVIYPPHW